MKKNLRFYFALFFAKGTALVLKIIGRKGTSMPGSWAIILCPDFLGRIDKPKRVIGITGTNGKTTVTNMVSDVLEANGIEFISNREGTNVPTGIASCLIANSTFTGKQKKQFAVFEMDERSSLRIFPYLKPDTLLVTNIFRDSFKRNAHTEYIFNLLNNNIPKETTLILNGDDPVCSRLGKDNKKYFFGMLKQEFENEKREYLVNDGSTCPVCDTPLTYDFKRYHHIGVCRCENCEYKLPEKQYVLQKCDLENKRMNFKFGEDKFSIKLADNNVINMYNQLCAASVLYNEGYQTKLIEKAFEAIKIPEVRLAKKKVGDNTFIRHVAKGQNPIACSMAVGNVRNFEGDKCVIFMLDDKFDALKAVENIAWYYDTDFEYLKDTNITQIIIAGERESDLYVRLLIAGIDPKIMSHFGSYDEIIGAVDVNISNTFVIYYDIYFESLSKKIEKEIEEKIEENKK